jgi:hypothetical protein
MPTPPFATLSVRMKYNLLPVILSTQVLASFAIVPTTSEKC